MPFTTRLLTAAAAGLAFAGAIVAPASAASRDAGASRVSTPATLSAATATARTSPLERRRVDSVPTPKLHWSKCFSWGECSTAQVPLDYDHPRAGKVTLAVLKVPALDQKHKIGSLFVNPGGPGGSAVSMALEAPYFLSKQIRERFDIIGMDPRGIGYSDQVECFSSAGRQEPVLDTLGMGFPLGSAQEKAYIAAAGREARACSTSGRRLAGHMSTAEVARDMDVMRRAVGDKKLSYLGFSYGTALGQYYANMFPDRFRAIVVDGVIDPIAWVGSTKTQNKIQDDRLHSADGAYKALKEIMVLCDLAGPQHCALAGNAMGRFAAVAGYLKKRTVTVDDEDITYAAFISMVLGALYDTTAGDEITTLTAQLAVIMAHGGVGSSAQAEAAGATMRRLRAQSQGRQFPYDNSFDAYSAVMCTDGRHPAHATSWPKAVAKDDARAPYLGRAWGWASVQCARDNWTVRDPGAYTGPFNKRTATPVMVVGSFWDPATNYTDAYNVSHLLPNSRMLSSNNWGHTAYGTSPCSTMWTDRYLLSRTVPPAGTLCTGTAQPFRGKPGASTTKQSAEDTFNLRTATPAEIAAHGLPAEGAPLVLPPVIG